MPIADGTEEFVEENGIEFHRIGANLIRTLLEALPAVSPDLETRPVPMPEEPGPKAPTETSTMQLLARELSKLGRAAFIRQERPRTVAWEKLSSSSEELETSETRTPERTPVFPTNPRMEPPTKNVQVPVPAVPLQPATQPAVPVRAPAAPEPEPTAVHAETAAAVKPAHDVLLGVTGESPQFGVLGRVMGRSVALDLNQTQTISLFGVQGGGKNYTLDSIIKMASLPLKGINLLPQPLATVVFHYSQTQDYKPEFTSMIRPNDDVNAVAALASEYQGQPAALKDIVLLAPSAKLEARRAEYPGIEVLPLKFASAELHAGHWRFFDGGRRQPGYVYPPPQPGYALSA